MYRFGVENQIGKLLDKRMSGWQEKVMISRNEFVWNILLCNGIIQILEV